MKKPGAGSAGRFEDALQQRRRQRARRILLATGVLMLLVGAFWSLFFAVQGTYLHAAVELVLALYRSAAEGRPVKLPLARGATTDFVGRFGRA